MSRIDSQLVELIGKREEVVAEIGLVKLKDGFSTRDLAREKSVKQSFARNARQLGINSATAKRLAELVIDDAVQIQRRNSSRRLTGTTALVVGGAGKMGVWTCRFLSNRGASVSVWDPRGKAPGYTSVSNLEKSIQGTDLIVVASPLGRARDDLRRICSTRPSGIVFDLCSIKNHLATEIRKARARGTMITSVHPMFGPSAASPRGRNVIVCECGSKKADGFASQLFAEAGAHVTEIKLKEHDELMAYVLGLPHLCNLVFSDTLRKSAISFSQLARIQGPSFAKMARGAADLSNESRRVYHDIQFLNPATRSVFSSFEKTLEEVKRAALVADVGEFRTIMDRCERYLEVD